MKLARITFIKGTWVEGFGSVMKLENVEVDQPAYRTIPGDVAAWLPAPGIVIVTPTAKVLIPWERVESVVTEWIPLKVAATPAVEVEAKKLAGAVGHIIARDEAPPRLTGLQDIAAGAQAHGQGMFAHVDRVPQGSHGEGIEETIRRGFDQALAAQRAQTGQSRLGGEQGSKPGGMASTHGAVAKAPVEDVEATSDGPLGEVAPAISPAPKPANLQPPPPKKRGGRK